jgi:hypothetical protein
MRLPMCLPAVASVLLMLAGWRRFERIGATQTASAFAYTSASECLLHLP